MLDALADDIQLPFKAQLGRPIGNRRRRRDEQVLEHRLRRHGAFAQQSVIARHVPPAQQGRAFFFRNGADERLDRGTVLFLMGQKHQPCAVGPHGWQGKRHSLAQEPVWCLDQNAGAVTRVCLAAARTPVLQIDQHLQGLAYDRVRPLPLHVDNEADATGIVLGPRIVKALSDRTRVLLAGHSRAILQALGA